MKERNKMQLETSLSTYNAIEWYSLELPFDAKKEFISDSLFVAKRSLTIYLMLPFISFFKIK